MIKAEFSASLLQSSVSHDLYNADLRFKKFLIIINVPIKVEAVMHFIFQDALMNRKTAFN